MITVVFALLITVFFSIMIIVVFPTLIRMKKTTPCGFTKVEKDRARWTEFDDSSTLFADEVA